MDRASTFEDAIAIRLLKDEFIPVAVDSWYEVQRKDTEGEFYRCIVSQDADITPDRSTQGFYVALADGTLVAAWYNRGPGILGPHLGGALRRLREEKVVETGRFARGEAGVPDARLDRTPPAGGLVVDVFARILEGDWSEGPDGEQGRLYRESTGRDRLWIRAEETKALARGELPVALQRRIARFHLIENTRGTPPVWAGAEVKSVAMRLARDGGAPQGGAVRYRLVGNAALATADGSRGFDADLLGFVEAGPDGAITRFDLVARGAAWGQGRYTHFGPKGRYTLAIAFALPASAAPKSIPPLGSRDIDQYWAAE